MNKITPISNKNKVTIEISGSMGSGKSTLAHYIVNQLLSAGIYHIKLIDEGPHITADNLTNMKRLNEEIDIDIIVKENFK
jgi:uridine kinase